MVVVAQTIALVEKLPSLFFFLACYYFEIEKFNTSSLYTRAHKESNYVFFNHSLFRKTKLKKKGNIDAHGPCPISGVSPQKLKSYVKQLPPVDEDDLFCGILVGSLGTQRNEKNPNPVMTGWSISNDASF